MAGQLLRMRDMQLMHGLHVPRQFYMVLDTPAPLAGMEYPRLDMSWPQLYNAGISNVACLCSALESYDPSPLRTVYAVEMEDLHLGGRPADPEENERLAREAVGVIMTRLSKGEGVVVHCIGGTGRTGTVIGCVLRSMGFPAGDVIRYLDEVNKARGRRGWPESPWQSEMVRRF